MRAGIMITAVAALATILSLRTIDRSVVLRFIAPTAFETRSIEEILEGGDR
ncbi:hypothetical protein [uncultured Paracoccus sp.]|uniref:hypothetical protein n=1 Tax=uncultured Paracoccus sp. TaxID=189685 RepID=UPI0026339A7F|nr:hypothetical protein [uncultured Paracoccus sp.]HMR35908.1 hypothetical protein [Paracoccus sp. (in: a-proteobacteria)]